VAIKILPTEFAADPVSRQRFEREAKTISSLNHPHICVLYDIGHQDGLDYIVYGMRRRREPGETTGKRCAPFGPDVEIWRANRRSAGQGASQRCVHRDLKPANIMLTGSGAKLLDFGLAKEAAPLAGAHTLTAGVPSSPITQEGRIVGTFQYMSPEQVEGTKSTGEADIFSLGAVLYEMVTGNRAFQGKNAIKCGVSILEREPEPISVAKPLTSKALERAIQRCLAKDPKIAGKRDATSLASSNGSARVEVNPRPP